MVRPRVGTRRHANATPRDSVRHIEGHDSSEPARYPFLSDEWIAVARRLGAEHQGDLQPPAVSVRMNMVVNEVPFGDGAVHAHMDSTSGQPVFELGHLEGADVVVTTDYVTAKAVFLEGDPQAGMQAFMAGKVQIQGDMTKLLAALQASYEAGSTGPVGGVQLQRKIRDITA